MAYICFSFGCISSIYKPLELYKEPVLFNPLPDDKVLDWFKLKEIADDILKCI